MSVSLDKKNKGDLKKKKRSIKLSRDSYADLLIFTSVLLAMLISFVLSFAFDNAVNETISEWNKVDSKRFDLVSKELNISKKYIDMEFSFFDGSYSVNANGDHYSVEFNDDYTKIEKIIREYD